MPEPGDFDVYLLAQSWSPHFCCTNSDRCTTVPWAFSAKHLSLHGLWPGYATPHGGETFPSSCSVKAQLVAETMPREYIDLAPSFGKWNPEKHRAEVGDLAKHEWKKHGTCSGLTPDQYWSEALRAMQSLPGDRGTPQIIVNNVGASVPVASLRSTYPKQVAIRMDKQCRLSEITSCWEKLPDGRVGEQIDCPAHVMKGRNNTVCSSALITALGQCLAADTNKRKR